MHNKHLIRLWMVLIFMALSSGAYLLIMPNKATAPQQPSPTPIAQNLPWTNVATNTAITEPKAKTIPQPTEQKNTAPVPTSSTKSETVQTLDKNTIAVTIEINGQKFLLNIAEKSTAYQAMDKLVADKKIIAVFKEFSGLGYFVDEIDGVKTDKSNGKYWIYYLNGKPAQLGISQYILKNNDLITWKYEIPQF